MRPLARILYISYDGALEPLGESQVVAYLERLARNHAITLLTFEKASDLADQARRAAMAARLAAAGITWILLRYHRWPPVASTAWDVLAGIVRARRANRRAPFDLIHARSYVPSLVALAVRRAGAAAFLFDMRGFWVDEKVEAGHWRRGGWLHRVGKWWERRFFQKADGIVSLTEAGVRAWPELGVRRASGAATVVIPTCVDLERFTPGARDPALVESLGLSGARVVGSVGTLSNWYLRSETLRFLAQVARLNPDVRVLIVTREEHGSLARDAKAAGVPASALRLARAPYADMPRYMRLFDAGVFFIRPSMAKRASSATRLAEFLASGVPVVINDEVGDSGDIVRGDGVGLVLTGLDDRALAGAVPALDAVWSDPAIGRRCRLSAERRFDLACGVDRYRMLYQRLLQDGRRGSRVESR